MDNASVVTSGDLAHDVLGQGSDMIADTGKKLNTVETKRGHTMAFLAAIGVTSDMMVSPKGEAKKEMVKLLHATDGTETSVSYSTTESGLVVADLSGFGTLEFTKLQVFDAIKVSTANGLPSDQSKAWHGYQAKEKLPAHLANIVSKASKNVGSRMSTWKGQLANREQEAIFDTLQEEENIRAALAGETATDVRRNASESNRTGQERIAEHIAAISKIAANDEEPAYDVPDMRAWALAGYSLIGVKPPVEKE